MFSRTNVQYWILTIILIVSVQIIDSGALIESVGVARNLTVTVFEDKNSDIIITSNNGSGALKLNVSWLPPNGGRSPTFYSVLLTTIPNENSSYSVVCPEESLYYRTRNGSQLQTQLPESSIISDYPELVIRPGCAYRVQVYANPRTDPNLQPTTVEYTVPECVGERCSCANAEELLPRPEVHVERLLDRRILITWNTTREEEDVKSYTVSIGVPILVSSGGLSVYNTTKLASVLPSNASFLWTPTVEEYDMRKSVIVYVTAEDFKGCFGTKGTYVIGNLNDDSENGNAWIVLVAVTGGSAIALGLLGFMWARDRKRYSFIRSGSDTKEPRSVATLTRRDRQWGDKILSKRNDLYVEEEIEDAIRKGEADAFEVSFSRIRLSSELGKGQFGKVFLATLEGHGDCMVAVKMSNISNSDDDMGARKELLEEIAMMKAAKPHPHLVQLVACCTLPGNPVCAILEYMEGGDLLAYLHRVRERLTGENHSGQDTTPRSPRPSLAETLYTTLGSEPPTTPTSPTFSVTNMDAVLERNTQNYVNVTAPSPTSVTENWEQQSVRVNRGDNWCNNGLENREFLRFAVEIAKGMQHLEAMGITHRDLAARNVLLDSNLSLKVSDFGLSRNGIYIMGGSGGVRRLPARWMSPEALRERKYSSKSDVWSFAIVLWEIGTLGAFPYPDVRDDQLLRHVLSDCGRLARPEAVSPELYSVMRSCWEPRPEDRPSFAQLLICLEALGGMSYSLCSRDNPCYAPLLPTREEL